MARKRSWTDEQLRDAVAASTSYRQVLRKLGLRDGSLRYVQEHLRSAGIDTRHFDAAQATRLCSDADLRAAVARADSPTTVLKLLGVELHSNNFIKLKRRIQILGIDTTHFTRERRSNGSRTRWSDDDLRRAVAMSKTLADTLRNLGLIPAGGNYVQVQKRLRELGLDTSHFLGRAWNTTGKYVKPIARPLEEVLVAGRWTGSHALKQRLFAAGLKQPVCELCGWAERAPDGRIPVELDHINGDTHDNRLENLRILCPNCHALQPTHRGLNQKRRKSSSAGSGT